MFCLQRPKVVPQTQFSRYVICLSGPQIPLLHCYCIFLCHPSKNHCKGYCCRTQDAFLLFDRECDLNDMKGFRVLSCFSA